MIIYHPQPDFIYSGLPQFITSTTLRFLLYITLLYIYSKKTQQNTISCELQEQFVAKVHSKHKSVCRVDNNYNSKTLFIIYFSPNIYLKDFSIPESVTSFPHFKFTRQTFNDRALSKTLQLATVRDPGVHLCKNTCIWLTLNFIRKN